MVTDPSAPPGIGNAEAGWGGWRSWFLPVRGDPLAVGAQQCTLPLGGRLPARISATWPWRNELATAFHRLAVLPRPTG
ncbi:hypothetical protein [Streptomyces sp. NPDC058086]|uniref:hypothetical protein n=1 Tax=Streptomyces sp. NPDC058086 TaxID=3346334 RepID=UPI0036E61B26